MRLAFSHFPLIWESQTPHRISRFVRVMFAQNTKYTHDMIWVTFSSINTHRREATKTKSESPVCAHAHTLTQY